MQVSIVDMCVFYQAGRKHPTCFEMGLNKQCTTHDIKYRVLMQQSCVCTVQQQLRDEPN